MALLKRVFILFLHAIFLVLLFGCTSPLQEALQQFETAPADALEQVSLLPEEEREIAVMSIMRSRPNKKYCTLLSDSDVKNRCLRMADFAKNRTLPTSTIEHIQSKKCSLHQDADTCWDLLAIKTTNNTKINSETFEKIKEICSQISLSIWQEECKENQASLIAQKGEIQLGFSMCNKERSCEEKVLYNIALFSVRKIQDLNQKNKQKKQIQRNRDFITQQRKNIISELLTNTPSKAYLYGETFLFFVTRIITDNHINLTSSLPDESILIKNCNQALHTLQYNKWDLENLNEWQQQYMTLLSKTQRKYTPRKFLERDIPAPKENNRIAFSPFVLRLAIPEDPLDDWTLCLLEGVARLEHVDTRLLVEAQSYPNTIIRERAHELLTFINSTNPPKK